MKKFFTPLSLFVALLFLGSCEHLDDFLGDGTHDDTSEEITVNFEYSSTLQVGGDGAAEISAFDAGTNRLFTVNVDTDEITVYDISDIHAPVLVGALEAQPHAGPPNSVDAYDGVVAVAFEATNKQHPGFVMFFDATSLHKTMEYTVGPLPDMVTFSPNGKYAVVANEGEPSDDYRISNDPHGSISIIDMENNEASNLSFVPFQGQKEDLIANGYRIFGPGRSLATDTEPEYVTISHDSKTAWVSLQENNGIARVNLESKIIEEILPLGYKDYSIPGNEIDPSDRDGLQALRSVPVFGMYQPDAIAYFSIEGMDYIVTANEGDAREYEGDPGFVEEDRIKDVVLDTVVFPNAEALQADANIGRLKITLTQGDTDGDGDFDELYSFGARSFTIWTGGGDLVYDSGNDIAEKTLELTPDAFNGGDGRSDDKGAEPEAVTITEIGGKQILFVGLERNNQIMVYDITNPYAPEFLQILSNAGDVGPEGVLVIEADESPTGKTLLVISNEVSGTVSFYEN